VTVGGVDVLRSEPEARSPELLCEFAQGDVAQSCRSEPEKQGDALKEPSDLGHMACGFLLAGKAGRREPRETPEEPLALPPRAVAARQGIDPDFHLAGQPKH
jgi:hypothetical protein